MSQSTPIKSPPDGGPALAEKGPDAGRGRRWVTWLVLLAAVALVALPVSFTQFDAEVSRWYEAGAEEAYLDGRLELAYQRLESAAQWAPDSPSPVLRRAEWRQEQGDYAGSVEDATKAVELSGDDALAKARALMVRSQSYQLLAIERGDPALHDRAIEDARLQLGFSDAEAWRYQALNMVAYARAIALADERHRVRRLPIWVGGIETPDPAASARLYQGLAEAEEAISLAGGDTDALSHAIEWHYQRGDFEQALEAADRLIELSQSRYEAARLELKDAGAAKQELFGELFDVHSFKSAERQLAKRAAAAYQRRAVVLDGLSKLDRSGSAPAGDEADALAKIDRKNASALYPNVDVDDVKISFERATSDAAVLDTRGFLLFLVGDFQGAGRDLAIAVDLAESTHGLIAAVGGDELSPEERHSAREFFEKHEVTKLIIAARIPFDRREAEIQLEKQRRTVAVIHYHRALLHEAMGKKTAAKKDYDRIKELGATPGLDLF